MLRILDRYLLRELLLGVGATALVLLLITVGGTFADALRRVATGRLPGDILFPVLGLKVLDALTILLPLAVFLGILMALGRLYRDSEMHVLGAAGMGPRGLLRPAAMLLLPAALLVGLLSLWLAPLAVRVADGMILKANKSVIAAGLEAGRFVELPGRGGIVFVQNMSPDGSKLEGIFIASERVNDDGSRDLNLVTAQRGALHYSSAGDKRFLALLDGHRYVGRLGRDDWKRMRYARSELAIPAANVDVSTDDSLQAQSTLALARAESVSASAELAWRIATPVTVLVLGLLALPLSRQSPREPRYGRLLLAILAYLLYANLMALSRAAIERGYLPGWLGMWWLQLLVAALAIWMLWRQYAPRAWSPSQARALS